ncbi:phasin family protein [Ferrimonas marina]|uniref:Phasin protein n=1 Tax=Ferrimonas marina TaxID=299255 RepID=A0A1M5QYG1_9GAMM|nr:phasin family protein [Ferrimonas marina]SHH18573.1 Phasin protein [Ferrimonas marina]
MLNDMKQQFEDGLQRTIDNQVKLSEMNIKFATEAASRNSDYLTDIVKSSTEASKSLAECKTPMQLLDKQTELATELRTKAEAYVKANVDALTSFTQSLSDLSTAAWQVPAAPAAPRRKTKGAE